MKLEKESHQSETFFMVFVINYHIKYSHIYVRLFTEYYQKFSKIHSILTAFFVNVLDKFLNALLTDLPREIVPLASKILGD